MATGSGPGKRPSGQSRSGAPAGKKPPRKGGSNKGGSNKGGSNKGGPPKGRGKGSGGGRDGSSKGRDDRRSSGRDSRRSSKPPAPTRAERSGWGSVARHGAAGATIGQRRDEEEGPRTFSPEESAKFEQRQARRAKQAERMEDLRGEARAAIDRSGTPASSGNGPSKPTVSRRPLPGHPPKPKDVHRQLVRAHGQTGGDRAWSKFKRAAKEFGNDQVNDARKTLKPLVEKNSDLPELHELYGLALYRLGRWDEAIDELELFRSQSGSAEQHPVLMDCHRAIGNWADVDELWEELGESSPAAELTSEGRIVAAGSLADRGDLPGAVRFLERGWRVPKRPADHHVRRAYALADLYERSGNVRRSGSLFGWIDEVAPGYGDVPDRLRDLGR